MIAGMKLAGVAAAASAVLSGMLVASVLSWKHRAEIAELSRQYAENLSKGAQAAVKVNKEVTDKFNEDLAIIATRPPPRTVLVCPDRPLLPGATAGADAEEAGGPQGPAGAEAQRDIGAFIAAESDRADRTAVQLNALIDWVNKVRKPE
jgi:hypothetical protein